MKKYLLTGFLSWVLVSFTMAQQTVAFESFGTGIKAIKDTTEENNQSAATNADNTKKGFKDLFENDALNNNDGPRLNPRAVSFVQDYMDKYGEDLEKMKTWGKPYFNMMDAILISYNLPKELKYLAVIESELKSRAISWAGAVGPWQLMPSTAIQLGLKVNRHTDERRDYYKSTRAAAKYLNDLYKEFGDWLLVIAAYNGGSGAVQRAIRRSGSSNFWNLQYYLPAESRNHVKKFIGTHYIFEGKGGLTTLTKQEVDAHYGAMGMFASNRNLTAEEIESAKTQTVSGKYQSVIIAKYVMMEMGLFNRYNPEFDKVMASANNTYELKLPADKMELFVASKYQILNESIQLLLDSATTTVAEPIAKDATAVGKTNKK